MCCVVEYVNEFVELVNSFIGDVAVLVRIRLPHGGCLGSF